MQRELAIQFMNLQEGDKIKLTNGEYCTFIRTKRTKFVGVIDGKEYNIPVSWFKELIEKAPKKEINKEYLNLKKGDMFIINYNNKAELFEFEKLNKNKIIGINPITKGSVRIDISLFYQRLPF